MAEPRRVFFFKTTMMDGNHRIREPVKLAHDAQVTLSPSRRRVLIMASGKSGAGKSTLLDILTHGADIEPQPTLAAPFPAGEGYGGLTRAVHLYGPVPLRTFCENWNLPRADHDIDLFFIDTEGTDNEDSDRLSMTVLPVLGAVADIRLCVMSKRPSVGERTQFLNGMKAASLLAAVRSPAVAVVVRQCGPGGSQPGDADRHQKRIAQDAQFSRDFRTAVEKERMQFLYEPDPSRFVCLCQPCWRDDRAEHRSSMTDLAQFIVRNATTTPVVGVSWIMATIGKVSSEIERRTNGRGIVNETEIWNSLLGQACDEAEAAVTERYREHALAKVRLLSDSTAALRFDVVQERDELFREAQLNFTASWSAQRADLQQLIPDRIRAAEDRLRQRIEDHLHTYRRELLYILTHYDAAIRQAEMEVGRIVGDVPETDIPVFNIVKCHREITQAIQQSFLERIHENPNCTADFPERISSCNCTLAEETAERVYAHHIGRVQQVLHMTTENLAKDVAQTVVNEMFPIGFVLPVFGYRKPQWRATEWVQIEAGRVLVAAGEVSTQWAVDQQGGDTFHSHSTQGHVLKVHEMPSHSHPLKMMAYAGRGSACSTFVGMGGGMSTAEVGGNQSHDHGETTATSSYPPYVCVTLWRRIK